MNLIKRIRLFILIVTWMIGTNALAALPANGVKDVTNITVPGSFISGFTMSMDTAGVTITGDISSTKGIYFMNNPLADIQYTVNADGTNLATFDLTAINYFKFSSAGAYTFTVTGFKAGGDVTTTFGTAEASTTYTLGTFTAFTGITGFKVVVTSTGIHGDFQDQNTFDSFTIANATAPVSNTAPALSGTFTTAGTVNDNATISPFSSVTVSDADSNPVSIAIAYTGANGTLTGTGITGSAGSYTMTSAALATVQANLQGLVFHPTANQVVPGSTVATTFTITPNDGTVDGTANATTKITATSVNDIPTNITLSSTSVNQSGGVNAVVGALSNTDADTGQSYTYTLVSGSGDTNNTSFNISGTNFRANDASLLAAGTYAVRLNVNDGIANFEKAFTITVVDNVVPTLSGATSSNIVQTTATVSATSNESGTMYYVITTSATPPTNTQVVAGLNNGGTAAVASGNGAATATTLKSFSATGLSAGTLYYVYFVATDASSNKSTVSSANFTTQVATNSDATLTASATVNESSMIAIPTTADTLAEKVNVFDFTITDGGTSDGLTTDVTQIVLHTSGTADFSKVTWLLNGTNVTNKVGTYSSGANTLTFSSLSISVANGGSATYTLSGYFNNPTGLTDNQTFGFSVDGDTDLTLNGAKTQMASTSPVTNNTNAKVDITATKLMFIQQPSR